MELGSLGFPNQMELGSLEYDPNTATVLLPNCEPDNYTNKSAIYRLTDRLN